MQNLLIQTITCITTVKWKRKLTNYRKDETFSILKMFKLKMNRNNAEYGNPRGQTRKQRLKIKLSLQKPEKLNGKKNEALQLSPTHSARLHR